jgi:hypothetical protein
MPGYDMVTESAIYRKEALLLNEVIMHNAPTGQSHVVRMLTIAAPTEPAKLVLLTTSR